ncbi:MAG: tetratricopeptide repeat protein, partial [Bacteroidota bacterium]
EAIDEYRFLDTAFARTDVGPVASFRIGEFLEKEIGDYDSATTFFNRASLNRNTSVYETARRKAAALTRYKELRRSVAHDDSLLLVNMEHDSLTMKADSLRRLLAGASVELGDIFETDLLLPDSAVSWYRWSLALGVDSVKSPRTLFVLAEIAAAHPDKQFGNPRDYYLKIIQQFPRSKFADQSREIVGLPKQEQQTDVAEQLFVEAERDIERERYENALSALSSIAARFPGSPFAAKSEYTIGWIYEHRLSKPDSALAHFTKLMEQHGSSKYAAAIRTRLAEASAQVQDTTKIPPSVPQVKQKREE